MIGEKMLRKIVEEVGTPVYVYDKEKIEGSISNFRHIKYPRLKVYFATMANSNIELLKILRNNGVGIFVNSLKHLYAGREAGYSENITFASTNLDEKDLEHIASDGVIFNVDSPTQLDLFGSFVENGKRVGLRVNFDCDMPENYAGKFVGRNSRIGMHEEDIPLAIKIADKHSIMIDGVHVYLGTNIKEAAVLLYGIDTFFDFVKRVVAPQMPNLRYVDIGGGIGIKEKPEDISFDYEAFGEGLSQRVMRLSEELGNELELAIEPGRSLLADTAVFVTKVTDVKYRAGKKIIGTDASAALFPRPLLYEDSYHYVEVLGRENDVANGILSDVCGKTTYSRDYLAKNRSLPAVERGDILVLHSAGSYCYSMISDFLGMLKPPEVLIEGTNYRIIREREKLNVR